MRARTTRRAAASKPLGGPHGRDRQSSARANRLGRSETPKPAGHRPAPPPEASPELLRTLRLLELADECCQRLIRRCRTRRDVRLGGPTGPTGNWNERDIDCRIRGGDPVAITDALRDAAETLIEVAHRLEIEMGIE